MAKKGSRTVLYEAIAKNKNKVSLVERVKRSRFVKKRQIDTQQGANPFDKGVCERQSAEKKDQQKASWPPKANGLMVALRSVRLAIGRFSIPKKYRKAALLSIAIVLIMFFGVKLIMLAADNNRPGAKAEASMGAGPAEQGGQSSGSGSVSGTKNEKEILAKPLGDHIIVIATVRGSSRDLVPVKEFYAGRGIDTVIENRGEWYFLKTKEAVSSPEKPGSEGAKLLDRIKKAGLEYKAPEGYGNFKLHRFQDAYGVKIR